MIFREVKAALLKKGWAGQTLSRNETVERLNPLIHRHIVLNQTYRAVWDDLGTELQAECRKALLDVGKLTETVHSSGGVAVSSVDTTKIDVAVDRSEALFELKRREEAFVAAIEAETAVEHQIRTRAVLSRLLAHGRQRLVLLRKITSTRRR